MSTMSMSMIDGLDVPEGFEPIADKTTANKDMSWIRRRASITITQCVTVARRCNSFRMVEPELSFKRQRKTHFRSITESFQSQPLPCRMHCTSIFEDKSIVECYLDPSTALVGSQISFCTACHWPQSWIRLSRRASRTGKKRYASSMRR